MKRLEPCTRDVGGMKTPSIKNSEDGDVIAASSGFCTVQMEAPNFECVGALCFSLTLVIWSHLREVRRFLSTLEISLSPAERAVAKAPVANLA